uniref:Uncharacterized protein n=1 Tax=Globodera rostochiensis TaxID=31243 RepID=A0A914HFT9_GLORO
MQRNYRIPFSSATVFFLAEWHSAVASFTPVVEVGEASTWHCRRQDALDAFGGVFCNIDGTLGGGASESRTALCLASSALSKPTCFLRPFRDKRPFGRSLPPSAVACPANALPRRCFCDVVRMELVPPASSAGVGEVAAANGNLPEAAVRAESKEAVDDSSVPEALLTLGNAEAVEVPNNEVECSASKKIPPPPAAAEVAIVSRAAVPLWEKGPFAAVADCVAECQRMLRPKGWRGTFSSLGRHLRMEYVGKCCEVNHREGHSQRRGVEDGLGLLPGECSCSRHQEGVKRTNVWG